MTLNAVPYGYRLIDGQLIDQMIAAINSGGITSINIATANGISGNVTGGTSALITLLLGAISPSSINASGIIMAGGNITGANLSGTNTGDQTIILTGDITGAGTGSFVTTYTGTVPVNKGGSGQTSYTDGQLLIGNSTGNTLTKATLIEGSGVTITNGNGTITIAATGSGGTVTSVSGTANRITSSGGSTPAIDISASYVGQSSITTLGTIVTGAWNADVIPGQYGGTGVNNSGKTITLGGNLITSGASALTLTTSGATNISLPTSGTLVNSAVTTLSSLASVGTITSGVWNAGAITSSGNVAYTGQAYGNVQTLVDAANIAWNMNLGGTASITLSTNRIMNAPTNIQAGGTYALRIVTNSHTLTWNAAFKWPGGVAPTLSTGTDIITFISFDGTTLNGVAQTAFA